MVTVHGSRDSRIHVEAESDIKQPWLLTGKLEHHRTVVHRYIRHHNRSIVHKHSWHELSPQSRFKYMWYLGTYLPRYTSIGWNTGQRITGDFDSGSILPWRRATSVCFPVQYNLACVLRGCGVRRPRD